MLKIERQKEILRYLDKKYTFSVSEMAKYLNVSDMTIRRDVNELADQNKLIRLYGGVQKLDIREKELTTEEKINLHIENKEFIGKVMNSIINDDDVVYVGAGTTILYALPFITKKNLVFITNSLIAFNYLIGHTEYPVQLTGGEYLKNTEEFVGDHAERIFERINVDIAFAATNGIFNNNVTTSNALECNIQRAAFKNAKQKVVVADSTKFNISDVYTFYKLSDLNYVITDDQLDEDTLKYFNTFGNILNKEKTLWLFH
mgnify:FL=1